MGAPMAKNLLRSKYEVKVFNRTKNKAIKLKKYGAKVCASLKEVVSDRDIVITMLSDDNAIADRIQSPVCFLIGRKSLKEVSLEFYLQSAEAE